MSSILKALKRLEQQKMVRKDADHDIAWIVRGEDYRPEKKRQWPMFVSLVAVALLAVLSTYWFMGGFHGATRGSLSRSGKEARSSSGIPPVTVPAPPQSSRPDTPPVSIHDSATVPPAVVNGPAEKILRRSTAELSLKSDREGGKGPATALPRVPQPQAALRPRPEPAPVPLTPKPSLPTLKVTGIAGEKDSPVHLAIVNGTSVVEGSMVNGVKVEKILPDRVRFTFENRSFDVPLDRDDGTN
jgi:general secretion pathway protein B